MELKLQTKQTNGVTVVKLAGRFDALVAQNIKDNLQSLADAARQRILIDMQDVDFIDSSGLGLLVSVFRRLHENDGAMAISGVSNQVRTIFELTRLHRVIDMHDNEESALAAWS